MREHEISEYIIKQITTSQNVSKILNLSEKAEINLPFDDGGHINLFFNKECDTISEIQDYFILLSVIYWIFLILISSFIFLL